MCPNALTVSICVNQKIGYQPRNNLMVDMGAQFRAFLLSMDEVRQLISLSSLFCLHRSYGSLLVLRVLCAASGSTSTSRFTHSLALDVGD